jgi:hypothetical protein
MYIITAWNELSEHTVRSTNAKIILDKAHEFAAQGLRLSIVRTSTGESVTVRELEEDVGRGQGHSG